jgi:hypothetical protein
MSKLSDFFLNSKSTVIQYETLEISHPNFSKVYWLVRNASRGLTATIETNEIINFEYYPLNLTPTGSYDHLDNSIKIEMGDLGTVIPQELDLISKANGFLIKPIVKYRVFRSDDLNLPLDGPYVYQISTFTFNEKGCIFEAKAPSLNVLRTGEIYTIERFPGLVAFV